MLSFILFSTVGAVVNRVRGGLWEDRLERKVGNKVIGFNKILNDVVFGLLFTILVCGEYLGSAAGIPIYTLNSDAWWVYPLSHGVMWLGRAPGWGGYIGGLIDKVPNRPETKFIDNLVARFDDDYIKRNTIALSIRGLFWGFCLTLPLLATGFFIPWPLLAGLLMGPAYLATAFCAEWFAKKRGLGWPWGEYLYGAILWFSVIVSIG